MGRGNRWPRQEAHLDRLFDRKLNQLKRAQRQRREQPVPPRIDVNISAET